MAGQLRPRRPDSNRIAPRRQHDLRARLRRTAPWAGAPGGTLLLCTDGATGAREQLSSPEAARPLFGEDALAFRLFTSAEAAEGHCEDVAPIVFWTAVFDRLDDLLT
jgi:hypothetical protein